MVLIAHFLLEVSYTIREHFSKNRADFKSQHATIFYKDTLSFAETQYSLKYYHYESKIVLYIYHSYE